MNCLPQDLEAAKRLKDFLPERIIDAHAHLADTAHLPSVAANLDSRTVLDVHTYKKEMADILCSPKELRLNIIAYPDKAMADPWPH